MAHADLLLPFCTIVAMDSSNFWYRVCKNCERVIPDKGSESSSVFGGYECQHCRSRSFNQPLVPAASKRVYRILLSVASETKVMVVICFDRPAQALMGCSADELFDFASMNPFAVETAATILEGQMFRMVLRKPQSGNAQHMRIDSVLPLASDFRPVIEQLKNLYKARQGSER